MRIIIIGGSFAGLSCAKTACQLYPSAEIILIEKEKLPVHLPSTFSKVLSGQWTDWSRGKVDLWDEIIESSVNVRLGAELIELLAEQKKILLRTSTGLEYLSYDYLILATGSHQTNVLASEDVLSDILTFKTVREAKESVAVLSEISTVVVVGAGQLGMECIDALSHLPIQLTLLDAQDLPLKKHVDKALAEKLQVDLEKFGVICHYQTTVTRVTRDSDTSKLKIETDGGYYVADKVILATNFMPNTSCLGNQIATYPDGSVVVDNYLRTNKNDVFAVGDLISLPNEQFGQVYMPMISNAKLTGKLAAINLLSTLVPLSHGIRIVRSRLFEKDVISFGLTQREAHLFETIKVITRQKDQYLLHLIFSSSQHRLLGAQVMAPIVDEDLVTCLTMAIRSSWNPHQLIREVISWGDKQTTQFTLLVDVLLETCREEFFNET